ncbi:isopenicillin N synthase family dioxygenase [Rhodovibrionaceae bacterium A322]
MNRPFTDPDLDKHPIAKDQSISNQVPIIDLRELVKDSGGPGAQTAIDQIAEACRTWGFFQVVNHGIPDDLFEEVWRETRAFFALPMAEKLAIERSQENPWGYYNNELTKNQRDKKEVFDYTRDGIDPIYGHQNRWPSGQQGFKSTLQEYLAACTDLSLLLLEAFCLGLDLPAQHMRDDFASNHTGFIRLNYYPVKDPLAGSDVAHQPVADKGVHHHSDAGALTVLLQDSVGGLQVYKDGYWHDVPPVPGALVINTGDMMQVWSNDLYQAAIHRVLAMENRDRYSLPFFFNPSADSNVSPLPTTVSKDRPRRYKTINWAHYRGARTDGDYADVGEEIQISQFRI